MIDIDNLLMTGYKFQKQGNHKLAKFYYQKILKVDAFHVDALQLIGVIYIENSDYDIGIFYLEQAIKVGGENPIILGNLGRALKAVGKLDDAIKILLKAIAIDAKDKNLLLSLGRAYIDNGQYINACEIIDKALIDFPFDIDFQLVKAKILRSTGNANLALEICDNVLRVNNKIPSAWVMRGTLLKDLGRYIEASDSHKRALELDPNNHIAYYNLGNTFRELKYFEKAFRAYTRAIEICSNYPDALCNLGSIFFEMKHYDNAIDCFKKAIFINPNFAEAYHNLASVYEETRQHTLAQKYYGSVLAIRPGYEFVKGSVFHRCLHLCDWKNFESILSDLLDSINAGYPVAAPFLVLGITDDLQLQRKAAEKWFDKRILQNATSTNFNLASNRKIKLGYFSADFHDHPVSQLITEIIENHDREHFEVIGFSMGPDTGDEVRKRISKAFDKFIDITRIPDSEVANYCQVNHIDIAIDLNGYTLGSRSNIFSHRVGAIQINFLGYPGTMANPNIDYIIADKIVIPPELAVNYSEKIVWLPGCFQPNHSGRPIPKKNIDRVEHGLPINSFVFCCFNNIYKILPNLYYCWMRILNRVENSVLWLKTDEPEVMQRLRAIALEKGIDPARILFADRTDSFSLHIERYGLADLFLDTFPYNAHTTASDALWAGLPIVTIQGDSFVSRVCASLLQTVELGNLVASSIEEYEELAVSIAKDKEKIKSYREHLENLRISSPLFDSKLFTKKLEMAFKEVLSVSKSGVYKNIEII